MLFFFRTARSEQQRIQNQSVDVLVREVALKAPLARKRTVRSYAASADVQSIIGIAVCLEKFTVAYGCQPFVLSS